MLQNIAQLTYNDWGIIIAIFAVLKLLLIIRESYYRSRCPPNEVSYWKVLGRVIETWLNTFLAASVMLVLLSVVGFFVVRMIGPKVLFISLRLGGLLTLVLLILSEPIIVYLTGAKRIENDEAYSRFPKEVNKLFQRNRWLMVRPRLYVGDFNGSPNACAFGLGIFGQYGVMISPQLYKLLTDEELNGVLAHEIAHIRHLDVGLLTAISILSGLSRSFISKLKVVKTPGATFIALLLVGMERYIFPIGMSTIQCEREYAADALAALYSGTAKHLISALKKISAGARHIKSNEDRPLSDRILSPLTPSHPEMEDRFEELESLEKSGR